MRRNTAARWEIKTGFWVETAPNCGSNVTENARAGELKLAPTDVKRLRDDVLALGEPAKA